MSSVGYGVLKSLIENNIPFSELIEHGLDETFFEGEEKDAYLFVKNFKYTHNKYPNLSTVEAEVEKDNIFDGMPVEPVEYWATHLRKRRKFNLLKELDREITQNLHSNNVEDTVQKVSYYNELISRLEVGYSLKEIQEIQNNAIERHNEIQLNPGISGIPFGFQTLDEITYGQQGGDLTILIGETRVGKSYLSLFCALNAYLSGYNVLFLSPEMPEPQIARRLLSLQANISENSLRKGKLSYYAIEKAKQIANTPVSIGDSQNYFKILPSGMFTDVDKVISVTGEYKPDLLVIDGFYLLHDYRIKANSAWQEAESIVNKLKNFCIHANLPLLAITQYNRQNPNKLSGAKGSMSIEMTASNFLSFEFESPEDRDLARPVQYRILRTKKSRNGDVCILRIKMDFLKMKITQEAVLSGTNALSENEPEFIDDKFMTTI